MNRWTGAQWCGAFAWLLAGLYGIQVARLDVAATNPHEAVTPRTFPIFVLLLLVAAGTALLRRRDGPPLAIERAGLVRALALLGLMFAFAVLVGAVGLWLAMVPMLAGGFRLLGERRPHIVIGLPVAIAVGMWGLLSGLLELAIPGGWLAGWLATALAGGGG